MSTVRRLYFASVALVALVAAAWGAVELVAVLARAVLDPQAGLVRGETYLREQVAWSAATMILALPVWVVHWRAMQQATRRADEATSLVFRCYILLVLGIAAVSTLLLTVTLARTILLRMAGLAVAGEVESLVRALGWVVAWGALWWYHAPYAAPSAPGMADSTLRRWYLYIVTAVALAAAASGMYSLVSWMIEQMVTPEGAVLLGEGQGFFLRHLFSDVPWAICGGVWWFWFFRRQAAGDEGSLLRRVYLYGAMVIGMAAALTGLGQLLYEVLRFLFGYRAAALDAQLRFLSEAVPLIVVGVPLWVVHRSLTREEEPSGATPARIYRYLLATAGLSLLTTGLALLLHLFMDFAFGAFPEFRAADWWRDELSFALTSALIGLPLWAGAWSAAQGAAAAALEEAASLPRRAYLFVVLLVAVLSLLGFGVNALYQVLQYLLSAPITAESLSELFSSLGSAAIASGVLAYHGLIARRELAMPAPVAVPARHRVLVLAAPNQREVAEDLRRALLGPVEVRTLSADGAASAAPRTTPGVLAADIIEAVQAARTERVLVILHDDGADVYAYE